MSKTTKVRDFYRMVGLPNPNCPTLINRKSFARRLRLITEELSEYCKAVANQDIVAIADGLGDLMYVVIGTAIEHGLPFDKVFDLIHKSNMSKKGGHFDKSKKWIKPPTYKPVDLSWLKKICK